MTRCTKLFRFLTVMLAACLFVGAAFADTVTLKDGTVLEGEVVREGDSFLYFRLSTAGIEQDRFILMDDVESIERTTVTDPADEMEDNRTEDAIASAGATRVAFITLEEMVGPFMNADALSESIERIADDNVNLVVLRINSGGGALFEIEKLHKVIEEEIQTKYRTVAWIESAISAASMTAIVVDEMIFMKEGNFGGSVGYTMSGGKATRMDGEELEKVLRMMAKASQRGGYDPLIMRAMEVPTDLSCDIDPNTGKVIWRNDLEGQYIVSTEDGNRILTFNSLDAAKYGFSDGTADTREELMDLLQIDEWVEVGQDGDEYMQQFREDVATAQVKSGELQRKMESAIRHGQISQARRHLSALRTWVKKAPSLEVYQGLDREFFRRVEEELRKMSQQINQGKSRGR